MKTTTKLAVFAALILPCQAAISLALPGNSENAVWSALNNIKYPSSAGYNTFGTNTSPFHSNPTLAALDADTGSTITATFEKTSGGGYFASTSIYNFGIPGTFEVSDPSPLGGLETVIFQMDLGSPLAGTPMLNFNGGTQTLAPDFQTTSPGQFISGFGGPPAPTTNYAWQWDLSSAGATSYEILFTTIEHGTIFQLDLAAGDTFTQAIPEPSTTLLGLAALTLTTLHRRRG